MASAWGNAWGVAWGDSWGAVLSSSRFAGGGGVRRRGYIIRGRKYWLTDWELSRLLYSLALSDEPVQRKEVKVLPVNPTAKPRIVSPAMWAEVKPTITDQWEEEEFLLLLA